MAKVNDIDNVKRVRKVRAWIKRTGISQVFLSKQIGISHPSYLGMMICPKAVRPMPTHVFVKIQNFFKNK